MPGRQRRTADAAFVVVVFVVAFVSSLALAPTGLSWSQELSVQVLVLLAAVRVHLARLRNPAGRMLG